MNLLTVEGLTKTFGEKKVFENITFGIDAGDKIGVIGINGTGKSTLLNIIGGIDNADSGYININGDKLEDMSEKKLTQYRRKHLGYVFQMYNLIGNLNVKENIEVGHICRITPLILMSCYIRSDFTSTATNCRTSCPEASSSVFPSAVRL